MAQVVVRLARLSPARPRLSRPLPPERCRASTDGSEDAPDFATAVDESLVTLMAVSAREMADHRPSAAAGTNRRDRNADTSPRRPRRFGAGTAAKARSARTLSLVTRPFHTSVHSASTLSAGYPPPTASCSAPKNDAP